MRTREHRTEAARVRPARVDEALREGRPDHRALLHLQRTAGNRAVAHALRGPATPGGGASTVQRTPAPRRTRPKPVRVEVDMTVPSSIPDPVCAPLVNTWDQANFRFKPQGAAVCEATRDQSGSFVREISFAMLSPTYEFLIAKHVCDNGSKDHVPEGPLVVEDVSEQTRRRHKWLRAKNELVQHGYGHFERYRAVVERLRREFVETLRKVPSEAKPAAVKVGTLEGRMSTLIANLATRLLRALHDATCAWEKEDYPRLRKRLKHDFQASELKAECPPTPDLVVGP